MGQYISEFENENKVDKIVERKVNEGNNDLTERRKNTEISSDSNMILILP